MNELTEERLLDLFCKKATIGLESDEASELLHLEKKYPQWKDDVSIETAAAAVHLTSVDSGAQMPVHLKARILAGSEQYFEAIEDAQTTFSLDSMSAGSSGSKAFWWQWFGWGTAALACFVLAFNIYLTRLQTPELQAVTDSSSTPILPRELNNSEKLEQLKNSADVTVAKIASPDSSKQGEISGEIVWSSRDQKGFMHFRGFPVNDSAKDTYQLWIFDKSQDEKYPIDGGVFNVLENGDVIIPIDAKINVVNPTLFAITKEKPGGVVVSKREDVIVIAKV